MKIIMALVILSVLTVFANAAPVNYQISWEGNSGYEMRGGFSFDQSLHGTGVIHADALESFYIEGYLNGQIIGSWNYFTNPPTGTFNFNFDTYTDQFLTGGLSHSGTGQDWNTPSGGSDCDSFGFGSGSVAQAICVDGAFSSDSYLYLPGSTLVAVLTVPIPVPAGIYLFLSGLVGLGLMRGRNA